VPCGSQVFPGGRGRHEVFRGAYMTGERTPLLRRPIVSGCARGAVRPNDLGICLELQARLVIASVGARVLRKGERGMVSSQLVDASCEVGKGLCRDILCLVRRVGVRHAVGPSSVGERPRTETRECRPHSCWWAEQRRAQCAVERRFVGCKGHVVGVKNPWVVAYKSYLCDDVQERAQNGGGDDADVGRVVVSFGSCFR
jgi:hypothetical protein